MRYPFSRRGFFSLNPIVFLLLLVLVGVFVWRGWLIIDLLSASNGNSAYAAGTRMGIYIGLVLWPLLVCAVAGGIGAALYFVTGRSDGAANAGVSLVLMLAIGFYGYGTYVFATQPAPTPPVATAAPLPAKSLSQKALEEMEAMRVGQQQQIDQARERMNNPGVPPVPLSPAPGGSGNPSRPSPAGTQPPVRPPATPAEGKEQELKAAAALTPLREEMRSTCAVFLSAADPVVAALGKPPRAMKSELDKRVSDTTDLRQKAADIEAYFRSLDGRIEAALKGAGVDMGTQIRQKIEFSRSVDAFDRARAAAGYKRLFEAGLEEAESLRDHAGKWRSDAAGMATSTDSFLNSTLRRLREAVQLHNRGVPELRTTLNKP